ncbi:MAG: tetratricopeptide repeat protein [Cyanobacteria bacterium P01_A01_bin.45]
MMNKNIDQLSIRAIIKSAMQKNQSGELDEAKFLYEKALERLNSGSINLNALTIKVSNTSGKQTIKSCSENLYYLIFVNLADIFQKQGNLEKAIQTYKHILSIYSEDSGSEDFYSEGFCIHNIYNHLGLIYQQQLKFDVAAQYYQKAIDSKSDYFQAYSNLGNILQDQGKLDEAEKCYRKALEIQPNLAPVYNNLANILQFKGKLEESIYLYQKALEVKPDYVQVYNNLGSAFHKQDKHKEAAKYYQKAVALDPSFAEAYNNLGLVLHELLRLEEGTSAYKKALEIKPDYAGAKFAICMSHLPTVYSSYEELLSCRNQYQQNIWELANYYQSASLQEKAEAAKIIGHQQPFFLPYQALNDIELQKPYGETICKIMASRYPQLSQKIPLPKLTAKEKIRVGFISGHFSRHSTWKIPFKGWIENLDRSEFELFGYHTDDCQDPETVLAAKVFDKFIQGPHSLEEWCEKIHQDDIHLLIFAEFGMDPMTLKLGCLRLAPIQICSPLGHVETSGMPTIDYYLSSDLMEPEDAQEHYTEELIKLPNLGIHYTPLPIELKAITKADIGIQDRDIMFWCCQSSFKYLPQHDHVFPEIAKELSKNLIRAKFVFLNNSSEFINQVFYQRLKKVFENLELNYQDYCIFLPYPWDSKSFAGTAAIADIYLDSIGWSGGNTSIEALGCNLPIVTLEGVLMRGRMTTAFLRRIGLEETIAQTKAEFVNIAVRLAEDAQYRQSISQKIIQNKHKLYQDFEPIKALENFIFKIFHKSRKISIISLADTLRIAMQHHRANNLEMAKQGYTQILKHQPNHPEALYGLGMLAQQLGELEEAEEFLNQALNEEPNFVKAWFSLGNLYQTQAKLPDAETAYRQAIALRPDAASIYNNLGYTLQQQGKLQEAIAYYQQTLELQPNCTEADVNMGNILHRQGNLSTEKQIYYAQLNCKLGTARQNAEDLNAAVAYYRQAIAINPDLVDAYYNLGLTLQQQGKSEEATACHQKVLELNPEHEQALLV